LPRPRGGRRQRLTSAPFPDAKQTYLKDICLGRFGNPETDIGPAALFLASEESRYISGQTINVDGGQVML
jgi:NAD(P)-dependent dehydrogenase (short-subunit alcohol dehydrogenase family)